MNYRALSLHQPWASLVALGVKTIETRSWSTKYRGPLAIHAAKRQPSAKEAILLLEAAVCTTQVLPLIWAREPLIPYGAVVATCELVDCLPMVASGEEGAIRTLDVDSNGSLWIVEPEPDDDDPDYPVQDWRDVSDQLPYGDFAPGRFAWLLADIKLLDEPVPARGYQGLWSIDLAA
jgi:hypothetical protein